MDLLKNSFSLFSQDGLRLSAHSWLPSNGPKALIVLVHGLGEHHARYQHLAEFYALHNIGIFTFDLRGHGESEGKRGHVLDLDHFLSDIGLLLAKACEEFKETPIIIYGHSLGGNLVANYLLKYPSNELAGGIITSPWLKLSSKPSTIQLALAGIMNKIYPSFTQSNGLDISQLSRDETVGEDYVNDPLVHDKVSVRLFKECFEAGLQAIKNAANLTIPLLLMHGTDDKITSFLGSEEFARNAGNNVTLKLWEDCRHETHNEIGKEKVLEYQLEWLRSVIK